MPRPLRLCLRIARGLGPFAWCLALVAALVGTEAQGAAPEQSSPGREKSVSSVADAEGTAVTASLIETKLKEADASTDLDEATKGKLTEQYRKVLSNLEAKKSYEAKAGEFAKALEEAPGETARLRAQVAGVPEQPRPEPVPADASLQTVEQLLAKQLADTTYEETRLATLDKALETVAKRPGEARARLAEVKRQIDDLDTALAAPAAEGEAVNLVQARRWALQTSRAALIAEGRMLEQELASLGVRTDLLRAKRDKSALDLKALKARQQLLETAANERRKASAAQARDEAKEAEREATYKDPLVLDMARQNTALGEELTQLTANMDTLNKERTAIQAEVQRIADEFRSARERLEIVGTNSALGQILGDKRRQLPDLRSYRRAIAKREEQIAETTLTEIHVREERRQLQDLDAWLEQAVKNVPVADRARVRAEIQPLAERRLALLEALQTASETYIRGLSEINFSAGQFLETATAYDAYLSERLLWVRSVLPLDRSSIAGLPAAVAWLLSPASWLDAASTLLFELNPRHGLGSWALLAVVAFLFIRRPSLRRAILATAEPLRRIRTDRFAYTLQAIGLSALVAAPVSALMACVGWLLATSQDAATFTKYVGQTFISIAVMLYYLRSFRVLCMPGGVADKHFRWPSDVLVRLRRSFDWVVFLLLPVAFVAQLIYNSDDSQHAGSLGRLAVLILLLGLMVFLARLLHPASGPLKHYLAEHPNGWANRLRKLWYPLVIAIPVALAALAVAGFLHTAGTLLQSIVRSLWVVLGLIVVHQAIARWLLVTRRSLALDAALERAAARKAEPPKKSAEEGEPLQIEEPAVNLASLDLQTRKLVGALVLAAGIIGLWMVWSDVLPAFTFLKRFTLWHHAGVVDGEERMVPVTLADLLLVLTILVTAAVAGRNLPALIEILLLQYTEMSSGSRYTVTTLTSYTITATAFLLIFSIVGLSWSQVQWLVAALGVGIGFGLQEIVANFISGLIILFERPVRVGDVVTIGGTTGTVSKIQIRATTIRNYDQQELLVPNKQFITGDLLNWSLSDQVNRVVITVGVEYGADTRKALVLLAEAAREHPRVLKEPPPLISFEGFGDNALTLVLRCYLPALDGRLGVTTELHQAIYDKFQAAGINIAFPQRDVHLSTDRPLDVRIHHTSDPSRATPAPTDQAFPAP